MRGYHVQCMLKKGDRRLTAWIPTEYAVEGKYIKVKENNEWNDGWMVIMVGTKKRLSSEVMSRKDDWKKQRQGSDI